MRYQSAYKPVIKRTQQPAKQLNADKIYINRLMAWVFFQLMQDVWVEFRQQPRVKGNFKWEKAKIDGAIHSINNRYKYQLAEKDYSDFWKYMCSVVDLCEPYISALKATKREAYAQKMQYNVIEEATLSAIMWGAFRTYQELSKNSNLPLSSYNSIIGENISSIQNQTPYSKLNANDEIAPEHDKEAWQNLYDYVRSLCTVIYQDAKEVTK